MVEEREGKRSVEGHGPKALMVVFLLMQCKERRLFRMKSFGLSVLALAAVLFTGCNKSEVVKPAAPVDSGHTRAIVNDANREGFISRGTVENIRVSGYGFTFDGVSGGPMNCQMNGATKYYSGSVYSIVWTTKTQCTVLLRGVWDRKNAPATMVFEDNKVGLDVKVNGVTVLTTNGVKPMSSGYTTLYQ